MTKIQNKDSELVDDIRYLPRDYEIAPFDAKQIISLVRQHSGWVSVESLPDEGRYIVLADTDDGNYVTEMEWDGKSWIYHGEPTYCSAIWISPRKYQSLPSPPTGSGKE